MRYLPLVLLVGCASPPWYNLTCYHAGKVVLQEVVKYNRLQRCYVDRWGYCLNIGENFDCVAKVQNEN